METRLGKIESIKFGIGGYQDAMLGLHITLGDGSWGVAYNFCALDYETIEWNKRCQWTEEDRLSKYEKIMRKISKLLKDAKVDSIDKLKGIPIEATFNGSLLKEWRILKEVL